MTIKLNSITSAPWNPRADITPESVAELAADIEANGLIQPITIWKDADGAWLCIAGNRRLSALQSLSNTDVEIPADHFIVFGGTEAEARALTFRENHHRLDLTPLGEAAQIAQFVADGMTIRDAAIALGITETKARRRARLNDLADAWKKRDNLTVDILEKIAAYPTDIQEKVARQLWNGARTWADIGPRFDLATMDLDAAKFDTVACAACVKRTGVEADLFGVTDGKLGRCLDCKCFADRKKAHDKAEIAKLTKGADEVVRCDYAWQLPDDDVSSSKKNKAHPCAYVAEGHDGAWIVRWAESAKAKAEREEREEAERLAIRAEQDAAEARIRGICDKLRDWKDDDENREQIESIVEAGIESGDENAVAYAVSATADSLYGYKSHADYAHLVRTFAGLAEAAGLSDADRDYLLAECPEEDDGEDEDE